MAERDGYIQKTEVSPLDTTLSLIMAVNRAQNHNLMTLSIKLEALETQVDFLSQKLFETQTSGSESDVRERKMYRRMRSLEATNETLHTAYADSVAYNQEVCSERDLALSEKQCKVLECDRLQKRVRELETAAAAPSKLLGS